MNPELEVDPENKLVLLENQGLLSVDFALQFNFGSQFISVKDQTYYAQPQRLLNEYGEVKKEEERPNYIQISDRRTKTERSGWQLAVTQMNQFTNQSGDELLGASIRFTNQQLASVQGGVEPEPQQMNPLQLTPGAKLVLLEAKGDEGMGTWIYRFGDAKTANESIALRVPQSSNPEATQYTTTLNWELISVPGN